MDPPRLGANSLSIVMPAYNEAAVIRDVILAHANLARTLGFDSWEIVCVDDGSTDSTCAILAELQREVPRLVVIRHECNQGIYSAFRRGFFGSGGEWIYETGSDGQWPVENLPMLIGAARSGADLVVGVRTNRAETYGIARLILSLVYNAMSRAVFGITVRDAGSVKIGKRETFCIPTVAKGVVSAAERIACAHRRGRRIAFVPILFAPRNTGEATGAGLANIHKALVDLIRCFLYYRLHIGKAAARSGGVQSMSHTI